MRKIDWVTVCGLVAGITAGVFYLGQISRDLERMSEDIEDVVQRADESITRAIEEAVPQIEEDFLSGILELSTYATGGGGRYSEPMIPVEEGGLLSNPSHGAVQR